MIKIGELWLNRGVWHGRRILHADYIAQATTNQVPELEGKIRGYGYLWWITPLATHSSYSASGMYGQLITVVPDLRAVIVISSRIGYPTEHRGPPRDDGRGHRARTVLTPRD